MKLSYSALNFHRMCERWFFYRYIQKANPTDSVEEKYGVFGTVCHSAIENISKFKTYQQSVNYYWLEKSEILSSMDINIAYEFVKYCLDLNYDIKENEQKLEWEFFGIPFVAYIDAILKDGTIVDWKTSTYNSKKVIEYEAQTLFYAWAYWKVTDKIAPKGIVVFGKAKKVFEQEFSKELLIKFEKELIKELKLILEKDEFNDYKSAKEVQEKTSPKECFFCAYKKLCHIDSYKKRPEQKINLSYDNWNCKIEMEGGIDPVIDKVFEKEFSYTMDGAHYAIKAMRQKGNMTFDGKVRLYKKGIFPRGFLVKAKELLKDYSDFRKDSIVTIKEINKENKYNFGNHIYLKNSEIKLRPYQIDSINKILKDKISMTEICTGAGKTFMAAEMINIIGYKTLFVVDVKMLMDQTKKEFEKFFPFEKIGTITEGQQKWENINVATIQTVSKLIDKKDKEFLEELKYCGMVIVDEAHGAKSKSYKKLLDNSIAPYKIALTGTAFANGNDSLELYRNFGFPSVKITTKELVEQGYLTEPEINFLKYKETDLIMNGNYEEVYDQVITDKNRMKKIEDILKLNNKKHLIIVSRIEHAEKIKEFLNNIEYPCEIIQGKTSSANRKLILNKFQNENLNVLIGTAPLVQKGLNIPNLDVIINISGNKGHIMTIQSLGRVLRKFEGKEKAYYYDFYDDHFAMIKHTKERLKAFKEQGYDVKIRQDL